MRLALVALYFVAMTQSGTNGAHRSDLVLTDAQNGKSVRVRVGTPFVVRLEAQLGTGFGWQVSKVPAGLRATGQSQESTGGPTRAGGRDVQVFRFETLHAGTFGIELLYRQPWDKETPPRKRFRATIVAR